MKRALWITCGVRGNAGDALLYDVTRKLFENRVDLDFRYVSEPRYIRRGDEPTDNVVIGPGGMFVQTNSSRHLHQKLTKQWDQFESKRFFLWSTGILERPKPEEVPQVRRVTERADKIIVRATKESEFIKEYAGAASEWSPCASLFTDKLLGVKKSVKDVVVVNLDDFLFTAENIADHPLRRFLDFANAQGLEVRSMVNAGGDANPFMLDLFPLIDADQPLLGQFLSHGPTGREFNKGFNDALKRMPSFGERYTNARFAFGKRLHGWLPFMAFEQPAAFIGMAARRGMSQDYFGGPQFLCAVPRGRGLSRDQLETMADMMIAKLKAFIGREEELVSRIVTHRDELWVKLQRQAAELADALR